MFIEIGVLRTDMVAVDTLQDRVYRSLKMPTIAHEHHIQRSSRSPRQVRKHGRLFGVMDC